MLRRLRRLRRLRLMSINLFLHRSKNIEKILKDQEYQGRNHSMLSLIKVYNKEDIDTRSLPYPVSIYENLNKRYHAPAQEAAEYLIKHGDNKLNFIVN